MGSKKGHGYQIPLPNGQKKYVTAATVEERKQIMAELLEEWTPYCNRNWMNDDGTPYSPEVRVKRFLDSLTFFQAGNWDKESKVLTPYKTQAIEDREIPISAAPKFIEDILYCVSPTPNKAAVQNQSEAFRERVKTGASAGTAPKKKQLTKLDRFLKWKEDEGVERTYRAVVDTEGVFEFGGRRYQINMDAAPQYRGWELPTDDVIYNLDYIVVGETSEKTLKFCDPLCVNIDPIHIRRLL